MRRIGIEPGRWWGTTRSTERAVRPRRGESLTAAEKIALALISAYAAGVGVGLLIVSW